MAGAAGGDVLQLARPDQHCVKAAQSSSNLTCGAVEGELDSQGLWLAARIVNVHPRHSRARHHLRNRGQVASGELKGC